MTEEDYQKTIVGLDVSNVILLVWHSDDVADHSLIYKAHQTIYIMFIRTI